MPVKAIILIGGPSKGTRFRPLSLDLPKPLFPIAGFPILHHHIEACCKQLGSELKEIILLGFYDPSKLQDFIMNASREFSVPIKYLVESIGLGTGGGLFRFRGEITEGLDEQSSIFVLHCDVFCSFPLAEMYSFHKQHGKICTILGTRVPASDTKHYGILVQEPESHEVLHYVEKPEGFVSDLASCGIYLFSRSIFASLEQFAQDIIKASKAAHTGEDEEAYLFVDQNVLPNGDVKIQLEQDILVPLSAKKELFVYQTSAWWLPIKHVGVALQCAEQLMAQYQKTQSHLLARSTPGGPTIVGNVMIHPSAQIHPKSKLGPNVSIGKNVVIGSGVRVKQAIILDNVEIKEHACVLGSIIGWGSTIGQWARVEGEPTTAGAGVQDVRDCGLTLFGNDVSTAREICVRRCIVLPHKQLNENCTDQTIL